MPRVRFTVWRMLVTVAVTIVAVTIAASLLTVVLWALDALNHGPYATAFNRRCELLVVQARIVGRPEAEVAKVLGAPSEVWRYWSPENSETGQPAPGARRVTTYNYAPSPYVPAGLFQVHCYDGVVDHTELLDD